MDNNMGPVWKKARLNTGMTVGQLAESMGIKADTVRRWERTGSISRRNLRELTHQLSLPDTANHISRPPTMLQQFVAAIERTHRAPCRRCGTSVAFDGRRRRGSRNGQHIELLIAGHAPLYLRYRDRAELGHRIYVEPIRGSRTDEFTVAADELIIMTEWLVKFLTARAMKTAYPQPPVPVSHELDKYGINCRYLWSVKADDKASYYLRKAQEREALRRLRLSTQPI